jgi:ABC-2 type transport system ATP-binding protein
MSIKVSGLTKVYGEQKAVDNITFEASKGLITGFLGPNGAGKSTTMKMVTGYLQPDGGSAAVCGINVVEKPIEARKKIGYLPESNALYTDMYIREYLDFVAGIYEVAHPKDQRESVIQKVGLTPEAHKKIGQLSKGYKQRVGLAAAIIHDPEVLILDEPTSGLDPNQIVEIRQVIKELSANKTILLSTHIMQEVEAICDHVIIINKGTIVANDTLAQLGRQQANPSIRVQFAEPLEQEWLARIPGVLRIEKLDTYTWEIMVSDAAEGRKALMQMSINNGFNINSLQQAGNLEDVFRMLTTQGIVNKS